MTTFLGVSMATLLGPSSVGSAVSERKKKASSCFVCYERVIWLHEAWSKKKHVHDVDVTTQWQLRTATLYVRYMLYEIKDGIRMKRTLWIYSILAFIRRNDLEKNSTIDKSLYRCIRLSYVQLQRLLYKFIGSRS